MGSFLHSPNQDQSKEPLNVWVASSIDKIFLIKFMVFVRLIRIQVSNIRIKGAAMKRIVQLFIALAVLGNSSGVIAQGIMFPEPNPRIAIPRPIPGPHPLKVKSLKIETKVQGQVATTRINQVFYNDLDFQVDGVFFYPLPEDSTFVDFATWDGDKKLRGEVLEREEARNRYLSIVRKSWDPGLLEYAGANLFQARVFPVPARGDKKVEFAYSQVLKADHGMVSYVYPLQSGAKANPQDIGSIVLTMEVNADQGIKTIYSPTHKIDVQRQGELKAKLSFEAKNAQPDRNFQLFYSLSNADFGMNLMTYREAADEGYFMIIFAPKVEHDTASIVPKDIIFVLDTSGSMEDKGKITKALSALKFGVRKLNAEDRFNIVAFNTDSHKFREGLIPASAEGKEAAIQFLDRQAASGGTNINEALQDALEAFGSGNRPRYLIFATDGLPTVGDTEPSKILKDVTVRNSSKVHLFSFGVGYDVNTFLLDQLASRNNGVADYIAPEEDLELKLSNFFEKVSSPVMTDIDIEWGSLKAFDIFPRKMPDMFRGSQLTVLGRYSGTGSYPLTLKGKLRNESQTLKYEKNDFPNISTSNDFLPRIWAMRKVGFLLDEIRTTGETEEARSQIIKLAKKYGFVTPYTSYLAADENAPRITGGATPPPPAARRIVPSTSGLQMESTLNELNSAVPSVGIPRMGGGGGGFGAGGMGGGMGAGMGSGGGGGRDAGAGSGNARSLMKRTPSEAEAVDASKALKEMKSAEVTAPQATTSTRWIGSKEFALKGEVWTDTAYSPDRKLEVVDLVFGSEALLKAIASDKQLAAYAALGKNVTVVHNGKVYRIHP
jgi:Ca-activated chloride channel homolog